ncbi:hypothetical protein FXF59_23290 [Microbispora tritici]|uniref:YCII-related domain-containing protein n=2 Tax=Microbispora TaxID=2005 RepID=A0ABY3LUU6_9ACTN|nr:hypothetical protein FED44_00335 [Microbispora fusca]TYB53533.1 hypothetical protein FXF59_23290 [Microbispora tritici]
MSHSFTVANDQGQPTCPISPVVHAGKQGREALVAGDGTVTDGTYPETKRLDGGFTILNLPSREAALEWARKIAASCRCPQEVREFQYDPLS